MKKGSPIPKLMPIKIAVVGEYNESYPAQVALNLALSYIANDLKTNLIYKWIDTLEIRETADKVLKEFHGIWSAPGGPFQSLEGALKGIQFARENNIPFLGTCAGFHHTVLELARNLLGFKNAQHEEYDSESPMLFIRKMSCLLAGKTMAINVVESTRAYECYQKNKSDENYFCQYGLNPDYRDQFYHPDLVFSGIDQDNEIRIIELRQNDFFMATLFVPQAKSVRNNPHPVILKFVQVAIELGRNIKIAPIIPLGKTQ